MEKKHKIVLGISIFFVFFWIISENKNHKEESSKIQSTENKEINTGIEVENK